MLGHVLPRGAVTLLLTDIEGSTRLWAERPSAMRAALARHDVLVAGIVSGCGGKVVKARGEGDSVFAVFPTAAEGVAAALDLQRALTTEPWPEGIELPVRIALHSGDPELREDDYYGLDVIRCARLRSLAHGGQVLLSDATVAAVREELPPDASLLDLGLHRLRDLEGSERIHQLWHPSLPAEFSALVSVGDVPHNLPAERSTFVGRGEELAALAAELGRRRIVTVLGPGGVGKTRLALRTAHAVLARFPDGAWLVDLAAVTAEAAVAQSLADVLGVREEAGRPLADTVADHLRGREALLLLDNCEHLVDASAQLVDLLLGRCSRLRVLVTSREALGVYGELAWPLGTLPVPGADDPLDPGALRRYPALELLADRAALARPGLRLEGAELAAAAGVCRRLDGIPLAIELAAARAGTMSLADIEAGLDDRFGLLRDTGPRTRLPRQRELEALIAWSHDLLDDAERAVFRRLAVFAGPFDREAAEAVASAGDILDRLVRRSLAVSEPGGPAPFRLLETIRSYAAERLREAGEHEEAARAHARHYVELAERLDLQRHREPDRLGRVRAAGENLRAGLSYALEQGEEEAALSLATSLWRAVGHPTESLVWFGRALALSDRATPARARALSHASWIATEIGDIERAQATGEAALAMAQELSDHDATVLALNSLATVALELDDAATLRALAARQLEAAERGGDRWYVAFALTTVGIAAEVDGDLDRAADCHAAALDGYETVGDLNGVAVSLVNLADVAFAGGDIGGAREHLARGSERFRALEDSRGRIWTAWGLGVVAMEAGDEAEAARRLGEAMRVALENRSRRRLAGILLTVAGLASRRGEHEAALRLLGAVLTTGIEIGGLPWGAGILAPEAIDAAAREALGSALSDANLRAGRSLGLENTAAYALDTILDQAVRAPA